MTTFLYLQKFGKDGSYESVSLDDLEGYLDIKVNIEKENSTDFQDDLEFDAVDCDTTHF